ncbi:hypothetical protein [Kibdelosporangium philippinense]|uniref:hypothetical protein n=1 Tax=Kibdelosporangium philippinense TaxID=211113 RepID=UPI0036100130
MKSRSTGEIRNARAMSVFTESTDRTPSTVFSSTGHSAPKTIVASFMVVSIRTGS